MLRKPLPLALTILTALAVALPLLAAQAGPPVNECDLVSVGGRHGGPGCVMDTEGRTTGFGGYEFLFVSASDYFTQYAAGLVANYWDTKVWAQDKALPELVYVNVFNNPNGHNGPADASSYPYDAIETVWDTPSPFRCAKAAGSNGCTSTQMDASDLSTISYANSEIVALTGQPGYSQGNLTPAWGRLFGVMCQEIGLSMGMEENTANADSGCMNSVLKDGSDWYSSADIAELRTSYGAQ